MTGTKGGRRGDNGAEGEGGRMRKGRGAWLECEEGEDDGLL